MSKMGVLPDLVHAPSTHAHPQRHAGTPIHLYTQVQAHAYMDGHSTHLYAPISTNTQMHTCTSIHTSMHTHTCTSACIHVHIHPQTYTCTHVHNIQTYTHIHRWMHKHATSVLKETQDHHARDTPNRNSLTTAQIQRTFSPSVTNLGPPNT